MMFDALNGNHKNSGVNLRHCYTSYKKLKTCTSKQQGRITKLRQSFLDLTITQLEHPDNETVRQLLSVIPPFIQL